MKRSEMAEYGAKRMEVLCVVGKRKTTALDDL